MWSGNVVAMERAETARAVEDAAEIVHSYVIVKVVICFDVEIVVTAVAISEEVKTTLEIVEMNDKQAAERSTQNGSAFDFDWCGY